MKVMLADFHKFIGYSGGIENVFAKMASALLKETMTSSPSLQMRRQRESPSSPCPRA